jgi:hypothetical protein
MGLQLLAKQDAQITIWMAAANRWLAPNPADWVSA